MSDRIVLNVGGTIFETTSTTLQKSSYFSGCLEFNDNLKNSTKDNPYFIDRDPILFNHVLNYLRDTQYPYPKEYVYELEYYRVKYNNINLIDKEEMANKLVKSIKSQNDAINRIENKICGHRQPFGFMQ
ncbi:hypothetical protein BH23THE1_BH23THE1_35050 [soil metagenome]